MNAENNEDEKELCKRTDKLEHAVFYNVIPLDDVLNDETRFRKLSYASNGSYKILYLEI